MKHSYDKGCGCRRCSKERQRRHEQSLRDAARFRQPGRTVKARQYKRRKAADRSSNGDPRAEFGYDGRQMGYMPNEDGGDR